MTYPGCSPPRRRARTNGVDGACPKAGPCTTTLTTAAGCPRHRPQCRLGRYRCGRCGVRVAQGVVVGLEQAECADDPAAQPQRDRVGGHEPRLAGDRDELRPPLGDIRVAESDVGERLAALIALHSIWSTASEHTTVPRDSGLVESRRHGKSVEHRLTPLGTACSAGPGNRTRSAETDRRGRRRGPAGWVAPGGGLTGWGGPQPARPTRRVLRGCAPAGRSAAW